MQHDITPRPGHYSNRFSQPAAAHITRRFSWHVLLKQRSCPLITGFSSIRVWVTQPRHQLRCLGNKRFYQASGEAQNPCCLYKGVRTPFRTHAFYFPIHSPPPKLQRPSVHLLCPQKAFRRCPDPEQEANGCPLPSRRRISKKPGEAG